jgi:cyclopropane-fatty-acyl-phospholipid synthase
MCRRTVSTAVSSIGLTEHIGPRNYPAYFRLPALANWWMAGGCSTTASPGRTTVTASLPESGFINRYVFPDGGLTGSGDIVVAAENAGLEVRHHENLREHYAMTLQRLVREPVEELGRVRQPTPG